MVTGRVTCKKFWTSEQGWFLVLGVVSGIPERYNGSRTWVLGGYTVSPPTSDVMLCVKLSEFKNIRILFYQKIECKIWSCSEFICQTVFATTNC